MRIQFALAISSPTPQLPLIRLSAGGLAVIGHSLGTHKLTAGTITVWFGVDAWSRGTALVFLSPRG
jgi:hypothetical protein